MYKHLVTVILLLFSTPLFAAHCPASTDFIRESGYIWGYRWNLTDSAKANWTIPFVSWFSSSAFADTFPDLVHLSVVTDNNLSGVKCTYYFSGYTDTLEVDSIEDKKVDLGKIDPSIFSKQDKTYVIYDPYGFPLDDYTITYYTCNNATSGQPEACSFEWVV